jgi:hypothetical protein
MRKGLTLLIFALIFGAFLLLPGQTAHVLALGAPTDNTTVPGVPAGDQTQDEIKPTVEYVLLGPTSQSETTPPNFTADFITPPGEQAATVIGDENWYLDVDINTAGWIYIYEYFPPQQASQGQWITYKWQLPESGAWQFGPFAPDTHEAEGEHIYRLWFYSDGQWAVGNDGTSQSELIYWTYTKGVPSAPVLPASPTETAENGFAQKVYEFFSLPVVLVACLLVILAGLAVLVVYLWRRRRRDSLSSMTEATPAELASDLPPVTARAKIALPNGIDIPLFDEGKVIGRAELARALGLDNLALISRRHFEIKSNGGHFYIEDLGSANGTHLNGKDISGKGPVSLNDDDTIEPAGTILLKFHIL